MTRYVSMLAIAAVAIAGCRDETPMVTAKEPPLVAKSVQLSWKEFVLSPHQRFDVPVMIVGFTAGVLHECRFEPATMGTVVAVPGACRIASGATVVPGRLIVRVETMADTASVVILARR